MSGLRLKKDISEMRVLIVDDNRAMRQIVKDMAAKLGLKRRDEAVDGKAALKMMKTHRYDLVLCDWVMPEMTGIDLLKAVRQDPDLKAIPFVMVTTQGNKQHVIEAIRNGVSEYLTKPFNFETVKEKIGQVLIKYYGKEKEEKL